jgi:cyd operon protein YbgT
MWYFTWLLGVSFAACCGVINVLWLEQDDRLDEHLHSETSDHS